MQEKTLVFEFCAELKRQLDATKRYAIVMTRDGDQYVDLDDRVAIARKANASLFISVHADTLSEDANVSGSTVYTVADHASDAEAARIAARENAADRSPGGGNRPDNPDVADILFDLKRRETRTYAHIFSRGLVDNLRGAAKLNHNPERSAGFVVLKAPEFPSVLVELGYLSNAQDVQSLTSAGVAGQGGGGHGQSHRRVLCRTRKAGQRPVGRKRRCVVSRAGRRAARRIKACARRAHRANGVAVRARCVDHRFALLEHDRVNAGAFDCEPGSGGMKNVGRSVS